MYDLLFTPMKIGSLEVKNRFVMPAMNSHYGNDEHFYTEQAIRYFTERAKGGFGLLTTEFLCVSEEGLATKTQPGIYDDRFIPMLKQLTNSVHQHGAKMIAQLHHAGRIKGKGINELMAVGPTSKPHKSNLQEVHELSIDEIHVIQQKFVDAALRAKEAGFDGVEIHGAHDYLLHQFLSKDVNTRVDRYGGSITNRARIVCEIIEKVKSACGNEYPVIVRTGGVEPFVGGNGVEDMVVQTMLFEQAGADALHVSYGIAIMPYYTPSGFNIENVKKVKDVVKIPVIGVGRINDPSLAAYAIKSQSMDFVALGRQSIADPHFPNKVKNKQYNEIFTCTGCMQRCLYSSSFEKGFGTSCLINPFSGKEGLWEIQQVETAKKIAIVGAGVAGLQAAWILAKKGHFVDVYEKEKTAGGQYKLASVPTMKQDHAKTISTYMALGEKYGVQYHFETLVTKEMLNPYDDVILATGAVPIIPRFIDRNQENIYLSNEVLSFKHLPSKQKVLILGAGLVGAETAELLAEYGNAVTIVDMMDKIAPLSPSRPREFLLNHLEELHVQAVLQAKVVEVLEDGITYEKNSNISQLRGFDCIVLAFGSLANQELYSQLTRDHVYLIGDSFMAGDAKKAIFEATELALKL